MARIINHFDAGNFVQHILQKWTEICGVDSASSTLAAAVNHGESLVVEYKSSSGKIMFKRYYRGEI